MECHPSQIVCELNRIENALREISKPGVLDFVAGIVVPLILGIATVLIAIFTIKTTRRGNDLSVELEERREARAARLRRLAAAPDLIEWATRELLLANGDNPGKELRSWRNKVTTLGRTLGEATFKDLQGWINIRIREYRQSTEGDRLNRSYLRITNEIESWTDDPDNLARTRQSEARLAALQKRVLLGKESGNTEAPASQWPMSD